MRYAPTVFGGRLFLWGYSFKPCERSLPRIERTGVGAYRIRPSREQTTPSSPYARMVAFPIFIFAAMEGVSDTPLQFLAEDFSYGDILAWHTNSASRQMIGKYVGAYRIRPSRERTTSSSPFAWMDALTIFIFAAVEGVCDTPLQFLAKFFSFGDILSHGILTTLPGELLVTSFSPP